MGENVSRSRDTGTRYGLGTDNNYFILKSIMGSWNGNTGLKRRGTHAYKRTPVHQTQLHHSNIHSARTECTHVVARNLVGEYDRV